MLFQDIFCGFYDNHTILIKVFVSVHAKCMFLTLPCCLLHCIAGPKPGKNEYGLKSGSHWVSGDSIWIIRECLAYVQDRGKTKPGLAQDGI